MNRSKNPYGWMHTALCALAISAVAGHINSARAQFSESQEFFDDGELQFEQQAETLERPSDSNTTPILTVEEKPADSNVPPSDAAESGHLPSLPDTARNEE